MAGGTQLFEGAHLTGHIYEQVTPSRSPGKEGKAWGYICAPPPPPHSGSQKVQNMPGQKGLRDKSQHWKIAKDIVLSAHFVLCLMIFPLCVLCIFLAILSFIPCVLLYRNNAAFDLDITHALEASSIFGGEWVKVTKRCAGYHTFGVLVLCPDYSWPWSPPASANHINFGRTKYKIS